MADDPHWLDDVIVVNDGREAYEHIPGWVRVFRNSADACQTLEVHEIGTVFVRTAAGDRVTIGYDDAKGIVFDDIQPGGEEGRNLVMSWLRHRLALVQADRRGQSGLVVGKREQEGVFPTTAEGIIAYIEGFERR
jgi:hypothetical protein